MRTWIAVTACLAAASLALVGSASWPATADADGCLLIDGQAPDGAVRFGGPLTTSWGVFNRYRFAAQPAARPPIPNPSPWIGVQYNSCDNQLRIIYGGYTSPGATHYNLRYKYAVADGRSHGVSQEELPAPSGPGRVRMYQLWGGRAATTFTATVQACKRGGLFATSTCTEFSPTLLVRGMPWPR